MTQGTDVRLSRSPRYLTTVRGVGVRLAAPAPGTGQDD